MRILLLLILTAFAVESKAAPPPLPKPKPPSCEELLAYLDESVAGEIDISADTRDRIQNLFDGNSNFATFLHRLVYDYTNGVEVSTTLALTDQTHMRQIFREKTWDEMAEVSLIQVDRLYRERSTFRRLARQKLKLVLEIAALAHDEEVELDKLEFPFLICITTTAVGGKVQEFDAPENFEDDPFLKLLLLAKKRITKLQYGLKGLDTDASILKAERAINELTAQKSNLRLLAVAPLPK